MTRSASRGARLCRRSRGRGAPLPARPPAPHPRRAGPAPSGGREMGCRELKRSRGTKSVPVPTVPTAPGCSCPCQPLMAWVGCSPRSAAVPPQVMPLPVLPAGSVTLSLCPCRVVLSVNDKWHYCQNSDILVGSRAMRDRHLRLLGYSLVQVRGCSPGRACAVPSAAELPCRGWAAGGHGAACARTPHPHSSSSPSPAQELFQAAGGQYQPRCPSARARGQPLLSLSPGPSGIPHVQAGGTGTPAPPGPAGTAAASATG